MLRRTAFFSVLALFALLGGCVTPQSVEPPGVTLQNVRILNSKGLSQNIEVDLLVSNPNDFDIPLTGLKFDMKINGRDFAQGLSNETITVPRLGRAVVPVQVTVSVLAVMQQIQAVQRTGGVEYLVAGTAFLDHVLLPSVDFEKTGKLDLQIQGRQRGFKVM